MLIYTVKSGDSIYGIAKEFGLSPEWIIAANDLTEPDELVIGQSLVIPLYDRTYTVVEGDTLDAIARRFSLSLRQLYQRNPQLAGKETIYPGETLVISYRVPPTRELTVNGYAYPFIEPDVLRRTLPYLTYLTVFTYGFSEDASIIEPDDRAVLELARKYGVVPILLLSTLSEEGFFNNQLSSLLLNNPDLQDTLINNLIVIMREKGYGAIDVDFEYVFPSDTQAYADFMSRLQNRMRAEGFGTVVSLAPKVSAAQEGLLYEAHSYELLGNIADRSTIMAYEWGYTYGPVKVSVWLLRAVFSFARLQRLRPTIGL